MNKSEINGIICINKKQDMTSHDVCFRARKILATRQVGHSGTLDPMATGVMGILVGRSTKLSRFITDSEKEYVAGIRFGFESDSYDIWTEMTEYSTQETDFSQLEEILDSFTGDIVQVPPIYSAIKVNGKPLYKYAREGKSVEIPERTVHIEGIELVEANYPHSCVIRVRCSKGTYIRSLIHDIGLRLGCHAVMESLERRRSGSLDIESSVTLEELEVLAGEGRIAEALIKDDVLLKNYPCINVRPESARFLLNGNILLDKNVAENISDIPDDSFVRIYLEDRFIAMGQKKNDEEKETIRPVRILYR